MLGEAQRMRRENENFLLDAGSRAEAVFLPAVQPEYFRVPDNLSVALAVRFEIEEGLKARDGNRVGRKLFKSYARRDNDRPNLFALPDRHWSWHA